MRVIVTGAIILAIIALLAMPPAGALSGVGFMGGPVNIGIPYVMGPDFTFAAPFAQGSVFMQAFNTEHARPRLHGCAGHRVPVLQRRGHFADDRDRPRVKTSSPRNRTSSMTS